MFQGVYTALITPFKSDGSLDHASFEKFVEWQFNSGIQGVVPCGTTGESPTLDAEEQLWLIRCAVDVAHKKKHGQQVIAGTGSNHTGKAIKRTQIAQNAGVDAAMLVTPYYNKPSEEGLYQHFKAIHDATDIPLILYNIPGRAVLNMSDGLIARLAELPRIVALKDATGDLARVSTLRMLVGAEFVQLSGEDMTALAFNAQGGRGVISVTSNVAPKLCAALQAAWFEGDINACLAIQDQLAPLHQAMFLETNPGPVKYAAHKLGFCGMNLRLPLVPPGDATRRAMDEAMKKAGIIE
ncbi:4-hydroxy-tetrahydrodipicolinate synthase [bacterium]|nr:4-hydroxy-tetrahydrodipicolinate synthase [bacterium]